MRPAFHEFQKSATKTGAFSVSHQDYVQRNVEMFGNKHASLTDSFIAKKMSAAATIKPKSNVTVVGDAPDGFGKTVNWAPDDDKLALIVFLNAADMMGVMISGVTKFDTIRFVSAVGIASFSEDTENEGVGAFIGIVAAGAVVTASIFGAPEIAPVIGAAERFAKDRFKEKKVKTKRRDPFGEDPGTGHKARQEGGVLVSLPQGPTTQMFTSGGKFLEPIRWIKEPGIRTDANMPEHMKGKGAFFLVSGSENKRGAKADGDLIIYPWDHVFEDNFGFYKLHILLDRSDGSDIVVE